MKNWKQIADASGFGIPDIDRITATLDGLEAAFRPLVKTIPHDVEPALRFSATPDEFPEGQS